MRTTVGAVLSLLVSLSIGSQVLAIDFPIPGKVVVVKSGNLVKLVSKNHAQALPAPGSADDPTIVGATLTFADLGEVGGTITFALDASGWSVTNSGYKYKGKDDLMDVNPKGTCRKVQLTGSTIKAVCKDDGLGTISLITPFAGAASVVLTTGSNEYCAELGGEEKKNTEKLLKRKDAPAPGACPAQCQGYEFAGGCWFDSGFLTCDDACAAQGLVYSDLTRTVAGSDGTNANCQALIAHFGWAEPFSADLACGDGYGCARDSTQTARCATPVTNSTAGGVNGRICACE